jgi:hypothetical protein
MTDWKWEDAALNPPLSSVERHDEKIASAAAVNSKDDDQHSHTRRCAETLMVAGENRATRPASHTQHTRESPSTPRAPDSECRVSFVRDEIPSFAPETRGFLPPCECASVCPGLLYTAPEPAQRDNSTTSAPIIAPVRWAAAAAGERPGPAFEVPCPERRGLVEKRGGAFLHFCRECGRWGAYGYGCSSDSPGRWYCREHRPNE